MSATVVDIANQALSHCGAESVLVNIDDPSKSGRLCTQHFDQARRATLAKHPWKFAIKRAIINLDSGQTPAFGWASAFPVPEDYIRAVTVNDRWQDFVREGRYILSNDNAPINLRYVSDEQLVEKFDPLFVDALALDLASRICYSLTQSDAAVERVEQKLVRCLKKARHTDAIEQSMQRLEADEYIDARRNDRGSTIRFDPGT